MNTGNKQHLNGKAVECTHSIGEDKVAFQKCDHGDWHYTGSREKVHQRQIEYEYVTSATGKHNINNLLAKKSCSENLLFKSLLLLVKIKWTHKFEIVILTLHREIAQRAQF